MPEFMKHCPGKTSFKARTKLFELPDAFQVLPQPFKCLDDVDAALTPQSVLFLVCLFPASSIDQQRLLDDADLSCPGHVGVGKEDVIAGPCLHKPEVPVPDSLGDKELVPDVGVVHVEKLRSVGRGFQRVIISEGVPIFTRSKIGVFALGCSDKPSDQVA